MKKLACLSAFVPFEPRILAVVETCKSVGDDFKRFRAFTHTYDVAGLHLIRCDVHDLTVDCDVTVKDELASSCAGGSNTETVYYVVKTRFEKLKKHFTGDTLSA